MVSFQAGFLVVMVSFQDSYLIFMLLLHARFHLLETFGQEIKGYV
jgi:hypothetical protein